MPNYPPPRLSNITNTSQRSSTLASQGAASTIINPTISPTNNNHTSSRSSNRVDSPTYSNIVQNITITISPFNSNTTTGLSDATTPNPTNNTALQLPTTNTSPPIDNNNNITADDDTHNTTALLPTKPSTVPTFNANYYHGLFDDDDDYDDFDDDDTDDERPLTQFDSVLPSTHNYQHSTKRHSPNYKDLLLSLPLTTLTTLGWTKCCNNCHELYLIRDDLTAHQTECIYFSAHISQQRTTTPFSLQTNMSLHLSPNNHFESTTQSQHE